MNRKTPWIVMAAIVLAGLTVGVMINLSKAPKRERSVIPSPAPQIDGRRGQTNRVLKTSVDPFTQALLGLKQVHSAQQAREQLARLKASLSALPTKERARVLLDFLESHADLPTTLDFKIGPNGLLLEAPTLRTFAIDA